MFPTKRTIITGVAATALALAMAAPAGAGKGGNPNPDSCGFGRTFSQILRDDPTRPGAGEARDLPTTECNNSVRN